MTDQTASRSVVVVGGGLAGLLFVHHLLRQSARPLNVTILEPRDRLGAGVAYSGAEPFHITNIPAGRMSVDPDDPGAFARWLDQHGHGGGSGEAAAYPRRWLFGDYAGEILAETLRDHPQHHVAHQRRQVRDIVRLQGRLMVETEDGPHEADAVVLATGNPSPQLPEVLDAVAASPLCIKDPWRPGALAGVPNYARVLVVGTGLTMGDTVADLRASGHTGEIVAVSRRGQLPRRGLASTIEPLGDFRHHPTTALGLLRLFRREVRRAVAAGTSWHAVLLAARFEAWSLWSALSTTERQRFVRHVRLFYELHRHVMPGPVHDMITAEQERGSLRLMAARLKGARLSDAGFEILLQPRGEEPAAARSERFDAIVNCTGPAYAALTRTDPLWASLTSRGLVRPDPSSLGPEADRLGRAVARDGASQNDLLLAGTLARSAFGELTGVREISAETRLAAETLLSGWAACSNET